MRSFWNDAKASLIFPTKIISKFGKTTKTKLISNNALNKWANPFNVTNNAVPYKVAQN